MTVENVRARHRSPEAPDATLPVPATDGSVAQWTDRYTHALMDTFGAPQRVLVRGEGAYVWDADGKRYLDLLGGIAVNSLGHAHPTLTAAISAQLGTLGHVSNFFGSPTQIAAVSVGCAWPSEFTAIPPSRSR